MREVVEKRLRQFWADALRKAGEGTERTSFANGAERLADRLEKLGYLGQKDGAYNPKSIAAWPRGARLPAAEVMFAVAIDLDMSLDEYVHGRKLEAVTLESRLADLAALVTDLRERLEQAEENQDVLIEHARRDPAFRDAVRKRGPEAERIAG